MEHFLEGIDLCYIHPNEKSNKNKFSLLSYLTKALTERFLQRHVTLRRILNAKPQFNEVNDWALDVSQFFNISVLSSLWRIISGESLKIHDIKLKKLCEMVHTAIKEQGDPFMVIVQQFPTFQNILNQTGICKRFGLMKELIGTV